MELVAWTMIGFAIVLYVADKFGLTVRRLEHITVGHAIIIGLAQAVAFIPGTSRSGITMVAARLLGFERAEAARFSFLLSIPAIAAAGLWEGRKVLETGSAEMLHDALLACAPVGARGLPRHRLPDVLAEAQHLHALRHLPPAAGRVPVLSRLCRL